MKTVFFEINNKEDQQALVDILKIYPDIQPVFVADKLTVENLNLAKDAESISVFIHSSIDKTVIDALPNLKLITTRSTGFDHIDVNYAKTKGIAVCNVPAYSSRTVAEFTFGLILGLSRKIFQAYRQVKDNHDFDISHFKGFDLFKKTIGVIGTGKIGLNVIQIAKGFGMKILAFDAFPNEMKTKEFGYKYTSLNELLANSDIITLHVPYNKGTHHLINQTNVKNIKPGALLINTSRGEVVDTQSLLMALKTGALGGAALDVLEGEKELVEECSLITTPEGRHMACAADFKVLLEDHLLINLPEVAITPHIAFFSEEAKQEILKITIDNIINFLQNQLGNQV